MTTMPCTNTKHGIALAAFTLLATLAACGSTDPSTHPPDTTREHSVGSATSPHDFAAARQVTVVQSGGLGVVRHRFVFAMDQPPPDGFTRADVAAVLAAAANPTLKLAQPDPGNSCCDRYVYRVSIVYRDGTTTSFTTVDGGPTTPAAAHLLDLAI